MNGDTNGDTNAQTQGSNSCWLWRCGEGSPEDMITARTWCGGRAAQNSTAQHHAEVKGGGKGGRERVREGERRHSARAGKLRQREGKRSLEHGEGDKVGHQLCVDKPNKT